VINFLIIAAVLFLVIKGISKLQRKEAEKPPAKPSPEVELLTEIRDILKKTS
jgi:large conductance mechanosensitive channel